ncbi:hypothetical protein [Candidatus Odyssella acanthamoebae]|uniref:Uncharacterized protein n=1 Tax=Candidatus Odyssella acanthamoebae TaxID=91604 RepID=A0A077AT10_9PROT|nr:hypothetical protein [Candidatus Paracaedibacter acanthamoebae]AIK96342.1 hypothetical protein ID47_05740 [Candidatus Paracaedibacter acanthamoebae]
MVKTKNIIKGFMVLVYASGVILAAERRSELDPNFLSQVLTIEPQTLTQQFKVKNFFIIQQQPTSTPEVELATKAFRIATTMLSENKGEEALGAVGLALYFGYSPVIDLIYHIGFGFLGHYFKGIQPEIRKQIRQKFLEASAVRGITEAHVEQLTAKYQKEWDENQKTIKAIEAKPQGWLGTIVQKVWSRPETVLPLKIEETVASSEKEVRKRSRSQESTAAPHLKSRQRKVADAEKQPLLQAGEAEEFRISNSERQPSSTSVRQRKPASPTKQPLPATDETRGPLTSEAKKRN